MSPTTLPAQSKPTPASGYEPIEYVSHNVQAGQMLAAALVFGGTLVVGAGGLVACVVYLFTH